MAKVKIFISYSHKDDKSREELEKWLITLKNQELIDTWFDGYMLPGDYFEEKIFKAMDEADVIILLLSQDYLSSTFCKREMDYAFAASKKKIVIPIILKPCTWLETANKDVLALPKNGKAVSSWQSQDEAWYSVFEGMKRLVEEFQNNFEIKDDFLNEIEYVEFVTQNKKKTCLSDIFVFPNLTSFSDPFEKKYIEHDFFTNGKKRAILIRGRETSGKSALLKWLYINFGDEYSALLLDGNYIYKTHQFDAHFKKEFIKQRSGDFDLWMKRKNKIVLIDNFSHNISHNIFDYLDDNFDITIITMDDEEYLLYFKDEVSIADFSTVSLGQFDLAKQEELLRKWFIQTKQGELQEISDVDIDKLEARVNNVITQQRIVPRYPFYILSILQSFASFMPDNIQITAYGHCYQALVTAQLVRKNIKFEDIDTCFNFLRHLSFSIYTETKNGGTYSKEIYNNFRDTYKDKFIITDVLINKMENSEYPILNIQDNGVRFAHPYIYYFFVGMQIAVDENESIVDELCEKLHLRENSFILIFTIHHTQNENLLNTIRLYCDYSFENLEPAKLCAGETKFMNELILELPQSILSEKSVSENRLLRRKNKGLGPEINHDHKKIDAEKDDDDLEEEISIVDINRGMKIIDVLGQILKNRAGSFERKDVEEILEDTINLGLRILNLLLTDFRKPEFSEVLAKSLEEAEKESEEADKKKFDDKKRTIFIEKLIQFFGYVVTVNMLNRIFEAIASEKLVPSMQTLSDKQMTPAYSLINFLVSSSQNGIDAKQITALITEYDKEKNHWAKRTLSYYVQDYLNTHSVNFKARQQLSDALSIKYLPNKK